MLQPKGFLAGSSRPRCFLTNLIIGGGPRGDAEEGDGEDEEVGVEGRQHLEQVPEAGSHVQVSRRQHLERHLGRNRFGLQVSYVILKVRTREGLPPVVELTPEAMTCLVDMVQKCPMIINRLL